MQGTQFRRRAVRRVAELDPTPRMVAGTVELSATGIDERTDPARPRTWVEAVTPDGHAERRWMGVGDELDLPGVHVTVMRADHVADPDGGWGGRDRVVVEVRFPERRAEDRLTT